MIHVTMHDKKHKLAGFQSVSTDCTGNPICNARRHDTRPGAICPRCYAEGMLNAYKNLDAALQRNREILTSRLISDDEAAAVEVYTAFARIESFGDVMNVTQARNYIRIINNHAGTNWGIYTKNPGIWYAAFKLEGGKPGNTTFGISACLQDVDIPDETIPDFIRPLVDFVFVCHNPETIAAGGPEAIGAFLEMCGRPNNAFCAGIRCAGCYKCYTGRADGSILHVHELTRTRTKANKAARAQIEEAYKKQ